MQSEQPEPFATEGSDLSEVSPEGHAKPLTNADLIPDRALERAADDRFQHTALARRVAQLVTSVEPRINVALYGSWGSGKSSLAGLVKEELRGTTVAFVYYDAWKFGGKALRRNFITNAASELELPRDDEKYRKYYSGLYQSHRQARFHSRGTQEALLALAGTFAVVLVLFLDRKSVV